MKAINLVGFQIFVFLNWTTAEMDLNNPIVREVLQRSKAADIKSWMKPSEDPCENFHIFACGKWQRINSATGMNVYSTDQFQKMSKAQQRKVDNLLQHAKTGDMMADTLRDFYESCRYVKNNPDEYMKNLQTIFKEYGQFRFTRSSAIDHNDDDSPPWWLVLANIYRTYGKSSIIALDLREDVKNKSRLIWYLTTPNFFISEADKKSKISDFLQTYFHLTTGKAEHVTQDLYDFEMLLMQGATDERSGKTVDDLLTLYNTTDLIVKYRDLMNMEKFLETSLNASQLPSQLYVYDEMYLQHLTKVMTAKDPQTVQDYMLMYLLEDFMVDASFKRWDNWCTGQTKKYFGKFLDYALYKQYRSEVYENEIFQLWLEIKDVFRENVKGNKYNWMSAGVRQHALRKLENMKLLINSYGTEDFQTFFHELKIDSTNYVANIQSTLKLTEHQRRNKGQNNTQDIDMDEVLSFTPVYNTFANEVVIPVALLQPFRLWHPLYPNAIKYATLGFLLAHEMIHGFDDEGRQFDANGHTHNWWDEQSLREFNKKRKCFQTQYHNYIYDGIPLESSVTQAENIADNAAVKLSYQAYMAWLNKTGQQGANTKSDSFRNLSYNNKELFFLAMAQLWCDDVHVNYRSRLATQDVHAPAMYRVIGSLANFNDFSKVFQCESGTIMNPLEKCKLY